MSPITLALSFASVAVAIAALLIARWAREGQKMASKSGEQAEGQRRSDDSLRDAEIARLRADLLYAESLIRRLLTKYEPDGGADHGAHERSGNCRVH